MGALDVLRCAISARIRVTNYRALSFPVKRCPFSTKRTVRGVLQYHPSPFHLAIDTISKSAEAAKTPQTIIEWFPAIKIGQDLFEIKWGGVCEEIPDLGSDDLKTYGYSFRSNTTHQIRSAHDFYQAILRDTGYEGNRDFIGMLDSMRDAFLEIDEAIDLEGSFGNDKVKILMCNLLKAPLRPRDFYIKRIMGLYSSATFPNQILALKADIDDVVSRIPKDIKGVSDAALIDYHDRTQLLIGEGKGYEPHDKGLAQVVMTMLIQCAAKACTEEVIWGFVLDEKKYTIVKLEVIGKEVVVTQYLSCHHESLFTNFIPLMGLSEHVARLRCANSSPVIEFS